MTTDIKGPELSRYDLSVASIRRTSSRATSTVFAPLGGLSRAELVVQRLESAIRSGLLPEGDRLPSEPELAGRLGVATVTAREALQTLRERGLVVTVRGRGGGSFVRTPSETESSNVRARLAAMPRLELADRADLYEVVTVGCAELAAERADAGEAAMLRGLLADEPEDTPLGTWRHTDMEFHLSLAALSQSARLTREAMRGEAEFGPVLRLAYTDPELRRLARADELALVRAIEAHDPARARDLARDVVRRAVQAVAHLRRETASAS